MESGTIDASEERTSNPRIAEGAQTIEDVIQARLSRRALLGGAAASVAAASLPGCASAPSAAATGRFSFAEIARGAGETHAVPAGYDAQVLLRWGDALFPDSPAFDARTQTASAQARQFGYNNDYVGFVPLDAMGARGLLCINHEYTSTRLMFPGIAAASDVTAEMCAIERAAHGASVVEVRLSGDAWRVERASRYNRRITAETEIGITGPAAGHPRLRTSADESGRVVRGMLNNCAGGVTPWGTYLTAEENFNLYFTGEAAPDHPEARNYQRCGLPARAYGWGRFDPRFDISREPNEPNRFGWVVEIDPLDPASTPKKRTALGRFKHEGCESVIAPDGRLVIYMGDDQAFDYVYKFVSARAVDRDNRIANADLLDEGVLYAARFDDDGAIEWLPLVQGAGPLTAENGFASQADVLIEARRAADLLGATPMDRPEDIQPDAASGRAYLMLTNNARRGLEQAGGANPRAANVSGHIIEIIEPGGDFASARSRWETLVRCGDPADPEEDALWNARTSANGWFGSPDNAAIDSAGRLWIATDGNEATGANDGLWALETAGELRGAGRAFFRAPDGAEVCGPCFAPDGRTLFLAVQHPGDGDGATFDAPTTRWPDFSPDMPPRPAVLAIRRRDGGPIGG